MASCAAVTGFGLFLLSTVSAIVSMSTAYWMEIKIAGASWSHWGLWQTCTLDHCQWVFENDFKLEKSYEGWFQVVQGCYTVGLIFGTVAMLGAGVFLCKTSTRCCINFTLVFSLLSVLSMAAAVIVFGVKYEDIYGRAASSMIFLSWSFFFAIAAASLEVLGLIFYTCVGCCTSQSQYARI